VHGVGKIFDIFAGQDIDTSAPTESNAQGIARTIDRLRNAPDRSLIFTNLVETDMIFGHRNDPEGFADSLREFDEELPRLLTAMNHGDLLILTSDHGCDPTTPSTDHSREHGLLLAHVAGGPVAPRRHDGATFADVGATVQRHLTGSHDQDLPGTPVL
jgi:phosphopentomutase